MRLLADASNVVRSTALAGLRPRPPRAASIANVLAAKSAAAASGAASPASTAASADYSWAVGGGEVADESSDDAGGSFPNAAALTAQARQYPTLTTVMDYCSAGGLQSASSLATAGGDVSNMGGGTPPLVARFPALAPMRLVPTALAHLLAFCIACVEAEALVSGVSARQLLRRSMRGTPGASSAAMLFLQLVECSVAVDVSLAGSQVLQEVSELQHGRGLQSHRSNACRRRYSHTLTISLPFGCRLPRPVWRESRQQRQPVSCTGLRRRATCSGC